MQNTAAVCTAEDWSRRILYECLTLVFQSGDCWPLLCLGFEKTICSLKFKEVYIINSLCLFSLLCLSPGYERGIKRSSGWACGGTRLGPEDPATLSLHQTACEVLPASQPSNPTPQPRPCSQTTCSTCEGQSRECRQQPQLLSRARDTETFPKRRCPVWEDPPDRQCLRE